MRPERYVLTTSSGRISRKQIWDSTRPLGIGHPFRWILERTPDGFRARNLAPGQGTGTPGWVEIPRDHLDRGNPVRLGQSIEISLRRVRPPKPAFLSVVRSNAAVPERLLAFAGVRHWTTACDGVHSAYVGYQRGKPVFVASRTHHGIEIKPLLKNVFVKRKGCPSLPATPNRPFAISWDALQSTTLLRGHHWWKFNAASEVSVEGGPDPASPGSAHERNWIYGTCAALMATLAAITISSWFAPPRPEIEIPKPEEAVVTFRSFSRPGPHDSEPAPLQHEIRESRSKGSETASAKQAPVPMPVFPAKAIARAYRTLPRSIQKRIAAENARRVQEALRFATTLTEKPLAGAPRIAAPARTESLSDADLSPSDIAPAFDGTSKKVDTFGGGGREGGGAPGSKTSGSPGYGGGTSSIPLQGGNSLVSMIQKDVWVQEGLTKEEVGAIIHQHIQEVRYCHETAMLSDPSAEGKIVLDFTINRLGRVTVATRSSTTFANTQIEDCLVSHLKTWRFPKPKGGVDVSVSYPFLFKVLNKE